MKKRTDFAAFNFIWALQVATLPAMLVFFVDWKIAVVVTISVYFLAVAEGRDADYSDYMFDELSKRIKTLEDHVLQTGTINRTSSVNAKTAETGTVRRNNRDLY